MNKALREVTEKIAEGMTTWCEYHGTEGGGFEVSFIPDKAKGLEVYSAMTAVWTELEPMLREVLSLGPLQLPHPDAPLNLSLTQWLKKTSEELYPWVATEPDGQVKPEARRALDAYVKARIAEALRGASPHQERASERSKQQSGGSPPAP